MGIFNLFKPSAFSKVHTLLQKNGLIPQATILRFAKKNGYLNFSNPNNPTCFTDTHRDKEILLLVAQNFHELEPLFLALAMYTYPKFHPYMDVLTRELTDHCFH